MPDGKMTVSREALFPVEVLGPAERLRVDFILDTGFNGELTLPGSINWVWIGSVMGVWNLPMVPSLQLRPLRG